MNTLLMDVYVDGKLQKRRIVSYYHPPVAGLPPMPEPELQEGEEVYRTVGDMPPTILKFSRVAEPGSFTLEISMNRTEWEDQVTDLLSDELEITRSDAQAIMEANEDLADSQWADKATPESAAKAISAA